MNQGVILKCNLIPKNKPGVVKHLLQLFGVASPEEWQKCYGRKNQYVIKNILIYKLLLVRFFIFQICRECCIFDVA
jgi:hypothetical protein